MKIVRHLIWCSFLILLGNTKNSANQNLYFDIIHNQKVIGSLKATKSIKNGEIYYHSSTNIETRLIKEIRVNYKYDVIFDDAVLKTSKVNITVNNKPHTNTDTERKKSNYLVIKNDKTEDTINQSIEYATIQLYFKEPKNISSCYSEQNGRFNTIKALGNHSYKKINTKGRENQYFYNDKTGFLERATIDGGLIKFEIVSKNKN